MASQSSQTDSTAPLPEFPDPAQALSSLSELLTAFKAAQDELRSGVAGVQKSHEEMDRRQQDMAKLQEEVTLQRSSCEQQLRMLAERTQVVEKDREELVAHTQALSLAKESMDSDREALANQEDELLQIRQEQHKLQKALDQRQAGLDSAQRNLAERGELCEEAEQRLAAERAEFEGNVATAGKQLEEIENTKQSLAEMQSQLAQEQQLVASQRADLLGRLGADLPGEISPVPASGPDAGSNKQSPTSSKRAEVDDATRHFRKLRRDAKRKVVGA